MSRIVLVFLIIFLFSACTASRFSASETQIIHDAGIPAPMRVLSVFNPGDSLVLRLQSKPLRSFSSDATAVLLSRMLVTVQDSITRGVGIAAPQVGISRRLILVQRFDKEGEPFEAYFNPRIKHRSVGTTSYDEGCLSIPGYRGPVIRPDTVGISYRDTAGRKVKEVVSGFTARIFQHEIDHLNGILYPDLLASDTLLYCTDK